MIMGFLIYTHMQEDVFFSFSFLAGSKGVCGLLPSPPSSRHYIMRLCMYVGWWLAVPRPKQTFVHTSMYVQYVIIYTKNPSPHAMRLAGDFVNLFLEK